MTAGAASLFDRDTALDVGDGVSRGAVDPSWFVTTGPNGGFVAALAVQSRQLAVPRSRRN